jgi:hypothetical protein
MNTETARNTPNLPSSAAKLSKEAFAIKSGAIAISSERYAEVYRKAKFGEASKAGSLKHWDLTTKDKGYLYRRCSWNYSPDDSESSGE